MPGQAGPQGLKGDTGDQGAQGIQGVPGAQGTPGVQGPSGVVKIASFEGAASSILPNSSGWSFRGATTSVTLSAGAQRVTASASLPVRTISDSVTFDFDICVQQDGLPISILRPALYQTATFGANGMVLSVHVSRSLSAGTYKIGLCTRYSNGNSVVLVDYVGGWVMVSN